MKYFIISSLLVGIIAIGGNCNSRHPQGDGSKKVTEIASQKPSPRTIELIDPAGLQLLVRERKGKMLLLNIWATWCQPCVEEFPDIIKYSKSQSSVEVIGISIDYPDEASTKVIPFLEKNNVPFKVYIATYERQEDFINALNNSWNGAIPATFIYDSSGKQRSSMIGQATYDQFKKKIDQLK